MAQRIAGIALMPRESRNGIYYDVEELKKFDGKQVPLRVEHGGPDTNIGQVTFSFDPEKSQVNYEATVQDPKWQEILSAEQFQVSIGAKVLEQRSLCDEMKKKCLNAPVLDEILELSVVRTPGIPEATLNVIESKNVLFEKIINEDEEPTTAFNGLIDSQRLGSEIADSLHNKNPDLTPEELVLRTNEILSGLDQAFKSITNSPVQIQPTEVPTPENNTSIIQNPQSSDMTTDEIIR